MLRNVKLLANFHHEIWPSHSEPGLDNVAQKASRAVLCAPPRYHRHIPGVLCCRNEGRADVAGNQNCLPYLTDVRLAVREERGLGQVRHARLLHVAHEGVYRKRGNQEAAATSVLNQAEWDPTCIALGNRI